jgi:hypothetical protein
MSILAAYDIVPIQGTRVPRLDEMVFEESIFRLDTSYKYFNSRLRSHSGGPQTSTVPSGGDQVWQMRSRTQASIS